MVPIKIELAPPGVPVLSADRIWFRSRFVLDKHSALSHSVQRPGTDDYRTMGSVHFSCVHNLRVSASAILLAIFAYYQGAEAGVATHSRLIVSAGNDNSLSIYWQCM